MWQSNSRMSLSFVESKGLLNEPGDNNCFLNSAVQVLWHLDVFRRSFRLLTGHMCMGNACIFCALKVIFTQFQYSDQSALPPDALRKALAKNFKNQQRFQLGLMDDAAECFENILTRIHGHITNGVSDDHCTAPHCISHQKFTQTLLEQVICPCGATSEPHVFNQMVHYVATNVLCVEKFKLCPGTVNDFSPEVFTRLLKSASSLGDTRKCPNNCGHPSRIVKTLTNSPEVISVGLIWNSDRPTQTVIQQVIDSIGTTLLLSQLYEGVKSSLPQEKFQLVGVVCYYGKHYSTFFYHSKRNTWISFDDATVKEMGSWNQVAEKCCRGHYQPLLLLYASPVPVPVSIDTALQKTTMVTGHSFSNESVLRPAAEHNRQGSISSVERALHRGGQNQGPLCEPPGVSRQGPEWGLYDSDEEVDKQNTNTNGGAHFRQSSYLSAMEAMAVKTGQQPDTNHNTQEKAHSTATRPSINSTSGVNNHNSSVQSWTSKAQQFSGTSENQNHVVVNQTGYPNHYPDQTVHYNQSYMAKNKTNLPIGGSIEIQSKRENVNSDVAFNHTTYNGSQYNQKVQDINDGGDLSHRRYPPLNQVTSNGHWSGVDRARHQNNPKNNVPRQHTCPDQQTAAYVNQPSWQQSEEVNGSYIDRKAVERVLGLQGSKYSQPARCVVSSQYSKTGHGRVYGDTQCVDADSHKNLAYCGGANVKTSTNSSTTSLLERLINSQTLTVPEHQPQVSTSHPTVDKRFSSEESLSSASAGSIGTVKAHGKATSYNNISRSQESLTVIEDNTKPVRDLIKKMDQPVQKPLGELRVGEVPGGSGVYRRPSEEAPSRETGVHRRPSEEEQSRETGVYRRPSEEAQSRETGVYRTPSEETLSRDTGVYRRTSEEALSREAGERKDRTDEHLFTRADGLMEMCSRNEQSADYAAALVHCQQAIGNLQQLMNRADIRESIKLHARMKYKSCVERSRALHLRVQVSRQASVTSTISNTSDDVNSSSTEDRRYTDTDNTHSASVGGLSKTFEFPAPSSVNVARTLVTEDFPAYVPLSQRRKFLSDYVSREDYFSHHPRPPQRAPKPSTNKMIKPLVPPKPSAKPSFKHSMSSENETHPGHGRAPGEEESINIYATLPRRPKNRERSSTLTGSEHSNLYRACVDQQSTHGVSNGHHGQYVQTSATTTQPEHTGVSGQYVNTPATKAQLEHIGVSGQYVHTLATTAQPDHTGVRQHKFEVSRKPSVQNGEVKTSSVSGLSQSDQPDVRVSKPHQLVQQKNSLVNHSRQWSKEEIRDLLVKDYYQSRTESSQSGSKSSLENLVDEQMKQLTLNSRKSSLAHKQNRESSQEGGHRGQTKQANFDQSTGCYLQPNTSVAKPLKIEGSGIQRVPPQQCVPKLDNYNGHPNVTIRASRGQTVEAFTKLEAHQLALLHRPEDCSNHDRSEDRQRADNIHSTNSHSNDTHGNNSHGNNTHGNNTHSNSTHSNNTHGHITCSNNTHGNNTRSSNTNVSVHGLPEDQGYGKQTYTVTSSRPVLAEKHQEVVVKPRGSDELIDELPPPPPELLEPLHDQTDSLQAHPAHFAPTTLNDLHSLNSYVVPGLQGIVDCSKISFAPHSTEQSRVHKDKYRKDKDLADFCVISKKDLQCDPYNDLSSSSGIERTDTQSDTSSVSTANSRNSRSSHGKHSKPALIKKRRHKPRKSVTFSDNVMLIARARDDEELPEEPNYIEYVQQLLKRSPIKSEGPPLTNDTKVTKVEAKTGYDSDFDEDTTDSCTSDEVSSTDKVQCNLCRKKLIEASYIYCVDCSAYMAKFQPS